MIRRFRSSDNLDDHDLHKELKEHKKTKNIRRMIEKSLEEAYDNDFEEDDDLYDR